MPSALRGHGEIAVIWHGQLFLCGGQAGCDPHTLELPGAASLPQFSPDGRWLAVDVAPRPRGGEYDEPDRVFLVSAAGDESRALTPKGRDAVAASWSPTSDDLAVATTPNRGNGSGTIDLMAATGGSRRLVTSGNVGRFAWSPDGDSLAVGLGRRDGSLLDVVDVATGGSTNVATSRQNGYEVAGWADASHILYWLDEQNSASLAADGLPLESVAATGGAPHRLVKAMLTYAPWLAVDRRTGRVAAVDGGDRELTMGRKNAAICESSACTRLQVPASDMTTDPAWSPSGALDVVLDRRVPFRRFGLADIDRYQDSGGIVSSSGRPVAGTGRGSTAPVFGTAGSLLFVRHDDLWLLPVGSRHAKRLVTGLMPPFAQSYYGYLPWQNTFAWSDAMG